MTASRMESVPWEDVMWRLSPVPGDAGSLDWMSGIVFWNADEETFERLNSAGKGSTPWEKEMARTQAHEFFHFYQVAIFGWLQRWVWALDGLFNRALAGTGVTEVASFDDLVGVDKALRERVTAEDLAALESHEAELHRKDPSSGLSVYSLIEGQAAFLEFSREFTTNVAGYRQLLEQEQVGLVYREAYDYAAERLGELAHRTFTLLCSFALCSSDPVMSFTLMIDWMARRADRTSDDEDIDIDIDRLIHDCCGFVYYGPTVLDPDTPVAPAYERPLASLRRSFEQGDLDLMEFLQQPSEHIEGLEEEATPAIVLRPRVSGGFPVIATGGQERHEVLWRMLRSAWYRAIPLDVTDEAGVSSSEEQDDAAKRREQVAGLKAGHHNALFNLGLMTARAGLQDAARVWWRLAAIEGDVEAIRGLGLTLAFMGDPDRAEYWLDEARDSGLFPRRHPMRARDLYEMGLVVDASDADAADECFRRSAQAGSVRAALTYGLRSVETDPVDGLMYLSWAAGAPIAVGGDPDELKDISRAREEIEQLRRRWGRRTFRRNVRQAQERTEAFLA
jgi:TPR repeat protein